MRLNFERKESIKDYEMKSENMKNTLNNILLFDIIKLISKLLKFNILELLNDQNQYYQLVPILIDFLEFDRKNASYTYCLQKNRGKKLKIKVIEFKKRVFSQKKIKYNK